MTCGGCVASVDGYLSKVEGVKKVTIDLDHGEAQITMAKHIGLQTLKNVLPKKYTIEEKNAYDYSERPITALQQEGIMEQSKFQQLKPLFLIFIYLFSAAFLLNYKEWNTTDAMLDFMGLFYIVFSFFKLLDLKGFPDSFRMYDPLAKVLPAYAWVYPFLELALGLLFLMRIQIPIALGLTIFVLGITTVGVTKSLLDKKSIRCACLGTALKLPMTEATFIENAIMLVMAWAMLIQMI
jgi:copper chaperone CopZ